MEVPQREGLLLQVDDLAAGLGALGSLNQDVQSLLTRLDKHLVKLNKVCVCAFTQLSLLLLSRGRVCELGI